MPHPDLAAQAARDFHEFDPRRFAREAIAAGELEEARVWAEISVAEAIHRLAKTVGRINEVPDSNRDASVSPIRPVDPPSSVA